MKKLSKIEQYAILHMLEKNKTEQEISHDLKLDFESVKRFIEKNQSIDTSKDINVKSSKVTSKDLMISQTSVKGNKSVSIMTKEASQVNDEFKKNLPPTVSRTAKNSIHRPNGK